jgi:hypothetical protein
MAGAGGGSSSTIRMEEIESAVRLDSLRSTSWAYLHASYSLEPIVVDNREPNGNEAARATNA